MPGQPPRLPGRWRDEPRVEPPAYDAHSLPVKLTELRAPPTGDMPAYVANAIELDFVWSGARQLPPPAPLIPRAQLRALAASLIAVPVPGEVDVPRLVNALSRGRLPRVLPREHRRGIARNVRVLVDDTGSMRLFQRDVVVLLRALRTVAGSAIRGEAVTHGVPPATVASRSVRGETLLVVTDGGIGGDPPARRACLATWNAFALRQRQRGVTTVAVVPFGAVRWPANLRRAIRMVHWHRPGNTATATTAPQRRRLAQVLSLAAVVDPALLRAARTSVVAGAGAGAEADFANGPWTAGYNPRVIVMDPMWVAELRTELGEDVRLLQRATRLLDENRPATSGWARVVFEERLAALSVAFDATREDAVKHALARVIRSLMGQMCDTASARWALCMLEKLPSWAQATEAAQLVKAVASIILDTAHEEVAKIVARYNAEWVFDRSRPVGVAWTGEHILVREPPRPADQVLQMQPARHRTTQRPSPNVVIVSDPSRPRQKVLRVRKTPARPGWTRATFLPRVLTTAAGAEYRLDDARAIWEHMLRAFKSSLVLTGTVVGRTDDRYEVDIGWAAFLPERELLFAGVDVDNIMGKQVEVGIVAVDEVALSLTATLAKVTAVPSPTAELWETISLIFDAAEFVHGKVTASGSHGCLIEGLGITTYVPYTEMALDESLLRREHELRGRTFDFWIPALDVERRELTLSRRFDEFEPWQVVLRARLDGATVTATVHELNYGGYIAQIGPLRAFVPNSQMDLALEPDRTMYLGKTMSFKVITLEWATRKIVLSRRELLEGARTARAAARAAELSAGDFVKGRVKTIVDFGAFIDLDGVDGLLYIGEMSWGRIKHPSDLVEVGQELELKVLDIDWERERISLSLKQRQPRPWEDVDILLKYAVGQRVNGNVVSITMYGAFIELEPGVEGMVHRSELAWNSTIKHPSELVSLGDSVDAVVLVVDREGEKIALSMKQLAPDPWTELPLKYPVGTRIRGKIRNLANFGVFVEIEPGIDGLVHISEFPADMSGTDPFEVFKKADEVDVVVIDIDRAARRIGLSMKGVVRTD